MNITFGIDEGFDSGPKMLIFLARHQTFPQSTHVAILISRSHINNVIRWIPLTKANNVDIWCFLLYAPEQMTEQTVDILLIWDTMALIMTSL